jgi:hypothetical protein
MFEKTFGDFRRKNKTKSRIYVLHMYSGTIGNQHNHPKPTKQIEVAMVLVLAAAAAVAIVVVVPRVARFFLTRNTKTEEILPNYY